MRVSSFSIDELVHRLKTEKGFSFARYGDGTFYCLLGFIGENCDGASLDWRQAVGLEESLRDTTITHGIGHLAVKIGAKTWLKEKGIEVEWVDCDVLHTAALLGKLFPFVQWLRKRRVLFIGPEHLRRLRAFPVQYFLEVHPTQAFETLDETLLVAEFAIQNEQLDTVLLSAGPSTPTMVSRLHHNYPWVNVLDTGSVWDPYVGVLSRKVFRKMGWNIIRDLGYRNFKQDISTWII